MSLCSSNLTISVRKLRNIELKYNILSGLNGDLFDNLLVYKQR